MTLTFRAFAVAQIMKSTAQHARVTEISVRDRMRKLERFNLQLEQHQQEVRAKDRKTTAR